MSTSTLDVPPDAPVECRTASTAREFEAMARMLVGQLSLREAQELVRSVMYAQALFASGGSRRRAAKLLGVDRRCVQRVAAQASDLDEPSSRR